AHAGPPRIKMYGRAARALLGDAVRVSAMNPGDPKWILKLDPHQVCAGPIPLAGLYVLTDPREIPRKQRVRIEPLSAREALVQVVGSTFNSRIADTARLSRNFRAAAAILASVPVRRLVHPRDLRRLPEVREAILADLADNRAAVA